MEGMIPQLANYEPLQLKTLHFLIFKKHTSNNHIKNSLKKFQGLDANKIEDHRNFVIHNFSVDEIIDICGILEVPSTLVHTDNVDKVIARLCVPVVEDNSDAVSQSSSITGVEERRSSNGTPQETDEVRGLIRQQSDIIFNLEQEIFEAEDLVENENSAVNVKMLDRLKRKLSIHERRKEALDSQYRMLERSTSLSLTRPASVKDWVNDQEINSSKTETVSPAINSLKKEFKSMLFKSNKDSQLSDFDGSSCIDWRYFLTQYEVSTSNFSLSNEENILRLNKHLKGNARKKVELILKSCINPDSIMRILNREYGGDEKILKEILTKVEKIKKIHSFQEFKDYNTQVQNIASVMSQLDETLFDVQKIMATLINRIPDHLIGHWANFLLTNRFSHKNVKMPLFSRWLDEMAEIVTEVSFHSINYCMTEYHHTEPVKQSDMRNERADSSSKNKTVVPAQSNTTKQCKVCKADYHPLLKCQEFTSMEPRKRYSTAKKFHFCVCCLKQHHGPCKNKETCNIDNCGRTHHELLHFNNSQDFNGCNSSPTSNVLLKIVSVRIRNGSSIKSTVALLDEGSTLSFIDQSLADELDIQGCPEPISFGGIGNEVVEELSSRKIQFEIAGENTSFYHISDINTISCLKLPTQNIDMEKILAKYPQLKNLNVSNSYSSKPQILLGQRHAALIISRKFIELDNGPICSKTKLGWALHGPVSSKNSNFVYCIREHDKVEESLDELIRSQFIIENHGVNSSSQEEKNEDDRKCLEIVEKSIRKVDGHFEVNLPWKNENQVMPNTYPLAMKRLNILHKKFANNSALKEAYTLQIEKLFDKGYARKISFADIKNRKNVWILPHFAVSNPNKPTKPPRVVFDAAAKVEGKSLNDMLYTGPDWLTSIIGVLIRFRKFKIAFAGDIREMFNQVRINDEDTFAQCFLWKNSSTQKTELWQMKAMLFGNKSSPFIAQFVKNFNAKGYEEEFPEAVQAIVSNHYVDDYLDGEDTVERAVKLLLDVIHVHKQGGFEIRSFISNNSEVLEKIPKHLVAENFNISMESSLNNQKILGMKWNAKSDFFEFSSFFKQINEDILQFKQIPTKRDVLKITMSIFDPLGLLSPITIKARLLMQAISSLSIGWDTQINDEMFSSWKKWLSEIKSHDKIQIPRCYLTSPMSQVKKVELHVFSDASGQAYCSAAYYRFILESTIEVSLVYAKSRVNPKSVKTGKLTIPKMELMAAVLGTRISNIVHSETNFKIDEVFYWTDSSTVMVWIQEKRKLPVFEANRVKIILESSEAKNWRWLSTKTNIADLGTRSNAVKLTTSSEWFTGPKFLYEDEREWEKYTGKYDKFLNVVEIVAVTVPKPSMVSCLLSITRYSSYEKLLNVTGWIGRFIANLKLKSQGENIKLYPHIDADDSEWALLQWVQVVQRESYPDDLAFINQGIRQHRRLIQHPILLKDGVMRIDGRLSNCKFISDKTKNPIVLDGDHIFVRLLVQKLHEDVDHIHTETVIYNFRRQFWMPKMKLKIKSIISKCLYCKHRNAQLIQPPIGNLPDCRFNVYAKPFKSCGIDYFGPYKVKIGRRLEDRYGVMFTCMTSRAIHVEIASTLNSNSCILAIRRMKSRRGCIDEILSDNASNFKRANKELLEAIQEINPDLLSKELQQLGIVWKNIPPRSPNFGGAWERMIGAFKRAIDSIFVSNRHPSEELLHTVFCEAEYLINSRPLYSTSNNPLDSLPVTPNDVLIPGEMMESAQGNFSNDEISKKTWRTQQFLIECFWKKFINEYIPTILVGKKKSGDMEPNLKVGDLVYLRNEEIRKGRWPLGIISKVYPGADSIVRVADVRVGDKIFKRASNQLALCKLN